MWKLIFFSYFFYKLSYKINMPGPFGDSSYEANCEVCDTHSHFDEGEPAICYSCARKEEEKKEQAESEKERIKEKKIIDALKLRYQEPREKERDPDNVNTMKFELLRFHKDTKQWRSCDVIINNASEGETRVLFDAPPEYAPEDGIVIRNIIISPQKDKRWGFQYIGHGRTFTNHPNAMLFRERGVHDEEKKYFLDNIEGGGDESRKPDPTSTLKDLIEFLRGIGSPVVWLYSLPPPRAGSKRKKKKSNYSKKHTKRKSNKRKYTKRRKHTKRRKSKKKNKTKRRRR
jgi:hypothetical protein